MKPTFEYRDPRKLKNHPLSQELYGETLDSDFVESCKLAGKILQPCRVLAKGSAYPEGTVIDGRRRRMVAVMLGFTEIPVIVEHGLTDKLDIDEQVILSNKPNEKTVEQRTREYAKLKEIAAERAAKRQREAPIKHRQGENIEKTSEKDVRSNLTEQVGRAADVAADAVGMSRNTAEKAVEVVETIDELEAKGKKKQAAELREKLESSVSAAHREVAKEDSTPKPLKDDAGNEVPEKIRAVFEMRDGIDLVLEKMLPRVGELALEFQRKIHGKSVPAGGFSANRVSEAVKVIHQMFTRHRPRQVCQNCLGPRCTRCRGRGWK